MLNSNISSKSITIVRARATHSVGIAFGIFCPQCRVHGVCMVMGLAVPLLAGSVAKHHHSMALAITQCFTVCHVHLSCSSF